MDYKVKLKNIKESCEILRLPDDAQGFVTAMLLENFEEDGIFVAKDDAQIAEIASQIKFFAPQIEQNYEILYFNSWDCLPFDQTSPRQNISSARIRTLNRLANRGGKKFLVIASLNAVLQKNIAPNSVKNSALIAKAGDKISIKQIVDFLVFNGYERQSCAYLAGEFALRGGIVDIVLNRAQMTIGYRLDFFGDEIESIKEFDVLTQLSNDKVKQIEILPATEIVLNDEAVNNFRQNYRKYFAQNFNLQKQDSVYESVSFKRYFQGIEQYLPLFYQENLVDFFSYLKKPVIFLSEHVFSQAKNREEEILQHYNSRIEDAKQGANYNAIKPELLYFSGKEFGEIVAKNTNVIFRNFDSTNKNSRLIELGIKSVEDFNLAAKTNRQDPMILVKEFVEKTSPEQKIFIATNDENAKERMEKALKDHDLQKPVCEVLTKKGFQTSDLIFIGQEAIFGQKLTRRTSKKNKNAAQQILEEGVSININELVVHRDYGIGKFDGIQKITSGDVTNDMIKIIYGGGDSLFISVEDVNLITRYGDENSLVNLDRLGVASWKNRKSKIKNRIKIAAEELIKVAAKRHVRKAKIFIPNEAFYDEFKARFGFVETDDQMSAIEQIEDDLAKGTPMDRLVCGDVGFGKTEVAMRAAFIVASNNYDFDNDFTKKNNLQVAIITPTTLLCRQHFKSFTKRFEGTNIKISQLSRLTSVAKNRETKTKLENGEIDIVIGTHALLGKSLKFKNLALTIIDEEQHFGVAQKERMKEFRNEAHILTLSATPIPRTLQMSLTGVKDLSLIATPPVDRLAVRNFVVPFDKVIVKEAILREYQRSGKVFFVVPRVKNIEEIKEKLSKILPQEIRVTAAHGQMTPAQLDQIMNDFYDDKIDVLLSTTIIESGIDIASANTMIIYKAEMFGLAQLYQLRGRVGRGKTRGYAYFLPSEKAMKNDAKKKLEVMQHLDELGVGFSIASHDMDIRGSGDILGDEQSGHIKETGVELYQQMLLEEIDKQKNLVQREFEFNKNSPLAKNSDENLALDYEFNPQIKLGISLAICEKYIADLALRMSFYKKIALVKNLEEQEVLENELFDRFGKIPSETKNLIRVSVLKYSCKELGISRIEKTKNGILISFKEDKFKNPDALLKMVFDAKNHAKLQSNHKVLFDFKGLKKSENAIDLGFWVVEKIANC